MSEHRIGNWYRLEKSDTSYDGSVYLLGSSGGNQLQLFNLETGRSWMPAVLVGNYFEVTQAEIDRVCKGGVFRLVHKAGED